MKKRTYCSWSRHVPVWARYPGWSSSKLCSSAMSHAPDSAGSVLDIPDPEYRSLSAGIEAGWVAARARRAQVGSACPNNLATFNSTGSLSHADQQKQLLADWAVLPRSCDTAANYSNWSDCRKLDATPFIHALSFSGLIRTPLPGRVRQERPFRPSFSLLSEHRSSELLHLSAIFWSLITSRQEQSPHAMDTATDRNIRYVQPQPTYAVTIIEQVLRSRGVPFTLLLLYTIAVLLTIRYRSIPLPLFTAFAPNYIFSSTWLSQARLSKISTSWNSLQFPRSNICLSRMLSLFYSDCTRHSHQLALLY